jgi:hypothetical protein
MFLRKICIHLWDCSVSYPRTPLSAMKPGQVNYDRLRQPLVRLLAAEARQLGGRGCIYWRSCGWAAVLFEGLWSPRRTPTRRLSQTNPIHALTSDFSKSMEENSALEANRRYLPHLCNTEVHSPVHKSHPVTLVSMTAFLQPTLQPKFNFLTESCGWHACTMFRRSWVLTCTDWGFREYFDRGNDLFIPHPSQSPHHSRW